MDVVNTKWLPHLHPEIVSETEGNYLDAYVMALEGWRRGLTLKWHVKDSEMFKEMKTWFVEQPGQLYSLHSREKSHYFFRTRGDKVTNEAVEFGMDKAKTKEILKSKNIAIPEGRQFSQEDARSAISAYAEKIGYPVVLKPTEGSFGRGVIANIKSEGELTYSLTYLLDELDKDKVILEKYIPGKDYRLYVVGDEVVGAILRVPPNVVGDGVNAIESLIEMKNAERNLNPRLVSCPIKANTETIEFMERNGHKMGDIPAKGETIYLNDKGNISIGGDPIDVLDELSEQVKQTAIQALQAIEGLEHGAVDMLMEEGTDATGHVIEVNPTAQLGGILFPMYGEPRDVPKAIMDYYFPETKHMEVEREKLYFDFYDVLDPLISRQATIATVSPAITGHIFMKRYTVFGEVQDRGFHFGLRKQAFERELHGYVMNHDTESIEIVVAGADQDMVDDFKYGITEDEERATIIEIEEEAFDGFVKIGFDSRANYKTIEEELKVLKEDIKQTRLEVRKKEVRKRKLHNSMSWKITSPVRIAGKVKKIFKRR